MGERYWTNDIIDPDEVATFGADCKGGANAFNSYWCSTHGHQRWSTRPAAELNSSQAAADVQPDPADRLPAVAVPRHRLQPVPVRRRRLGARVPRDPARQLRPVAGDADGRAQHCTASRAGRASREAADYDEGGTEPFGTLPAAPRAPGHRPVRDHAGHVLPAPADPRRPGAGHPGQQLHARSGPRRSTTGLGPEQADLVAVRAVHGPPVPRQPGLLVLLQRAGHHGDRAAHLRRRCSWSSTARCWPR